MAALLELHAELPGGGGNTGDEEGEGGGGGGDARGAPLPRAGRAALEAGVSLNRITTSKLAH